MLSFALRYKKYEVMCTLAPSNDNVLSSQTGAEVSTGVPGRAAKYAPDLKSIEAPQTHNTIYTHASEVRGHRGTRGEAWSDKVETVRPSESL